MSNLQIGRRYASALLGEATGQDAAKAFGEALEGAVECCTSPEAHMALTSPGIPVEDRRQILGDLIKALSLDETVRRFLLVLFDAGRIESLADVASAYKALFEERFELRTALVEVACPMSDELAGELRTKLEALTGGRVELTFQDNPELIAGWRARVGNHLIEADLASRAQRLGEQVVKG